MSASSEDLAQPSVDFLQRLELLPVPVDKAKGVSVAETPYSLQVITAGGLTISKFWAGAIGAVGGLGAVWTAIQGFLLEQEVPVRIAYLAGATIVIAVVALSIAMIVRADVEARAQGTLAQFAARASVAAAFLQTTGNLQAKLDASDPNPQDDLLASLASSGRLKVRREGDATAQAVTGVRRQAQEGLQLQIAGDLIPVRSVKTFELTR